MPLQRVIDSKDLLRADETGSSPARSHFGPGNEERLPANNVATAALSRGAVPATEVAEANGLCVPSAGCDECGAQVAVCVLLGYDHGTPLYRRSCIDCDGRWLSGVRAKYAGPRTGVREGLASAALVLGVILGSLGLAADSLSLHPEAGFGHFQQLGVLGGLFSLLVGVLVRIDTIAILGVLVFGAAALADLIGPSGEAGMGWKQATAIMLSAVLILASVALRMSLIRSARR